MDYAELEKAAGEIGFTHIAPLDPSTIVLKEEVRKMCEANTCGRYNKCWSCPPGCGSLEEFAEQIKGYQHGILVQTVGEIEDSMDFEAMMDAEALHKRHFLQMNEFLRGKYPKTLAIGTGSCTQCKECTYPDAPCRFPDRRVSSMEAYGMLVLEVCKDNHLGYYYGPNTIAYTGCFLVD